MSLSHKYIKEVAEVASLVGYTWYTQNCFIWFCVQGGKIPDLGGRQAVLQKLLLLLRLSLSIGVPFKQNKY